MLLAHPPPEGPRTVEVIKTEEKGSDVNLATYLLLDAFNDDYDTAVVISNDSDLVHPIEVVIHDVGKPVGVINPQRMTKSWSLQNAAVFYRGIRESALRESQFPETLADDNGTIHKPAAW
jgi:uncharacterized LabA/DUF88 family protein